MRAHDDEAVWNGVVLAESDDTVMAERNHHSPLVSSRQHISHGGEITPDAAWQYEDPSPLAHTVQDRVAFWRGVVVHDDKADEKQGRR